nr:MAG TPA: hypothetical protein [Caudoviricetes sp.]
MSKNKRNSNQVAAQIAAEEKEEDILTAAAEDVMAVGEDGSETPLTALAPELAEQEVQVEPQAVVPAPENQTMYTAEQVAQMVQEAAAKAVAEVMKSIPQQPQVVQVMADTEKVVMRWMAPVADDNVAVFGQNGMYGQVTGKNGTVIVPKSEWSRFYDETMRRFMERRWLVVLSGMSDDERALYHCNYRKGEIMDEKAFANIFIMRDGLLDVFDDLCTEHQEMVAKSFWEAAQDGKLDGSWRGLVKALNAKNKKRYKDVPAGDVRKKGMFQPVIDMLNGAEDEDE